MIARGHVQGGVVVLADGVRLAEGQQVTVFARPSPPALGADPAIGPGLPTPPPPERRDALLGLIGLCKTDNPPDDEEVKRIVEEARMRKYAD